MKEVIVETTHTILVNFRTETDRTLEMVIRYKRGRDAAVKATVYADRVKAILTSKDEG